MQQMNVAVSPREATGKGPNRQLRMKGLIPAVIYGTGGEVQKVSLNNHDFEKLLKGADAENSILKLGFSNSDEESNAIIREIQRDPLTRRILHVDLYRIRMDVENDFEVSIHGLGTPAGVREGGILETHMREVEIRCLPTNLPPGISIDLVELRVNQSVHVRDLKVPEGVQILTDPDQVIFTIVPPKAEAVPVAAVEGEPAAAEPEVIGKKKEEGAEEKK